MRITNAVAGSQIAASGGRAIAAAIAFSLLAACNSGSLSEGLAPTAEMRSGVSASQAPTPPASLGSESALAAQPPVSQAADAVLRQPAQQPQGQTALLQQPQAPAAPGQQSLPPVSFLPVTGAPQSAVTALASSMRQAAQSQAVPVVVSLERGARFQVKGYFSALNDGNGTILVYVWDVLDANGVRVHRISGQERGGGGAGDPWTGITEDVLDRVARTTMASLRTWMSTRGAG